jgi:multiple sugar transport system ATP-binding protein
VTELMGNEVLVYYNIGGKAFVGRVDPRTTAKVGEKMPVVLNMENIHVFNRETQRAIR